MLSALAHRKFWRLLALLGVWAQDFQLNWNELFICDADKLTGLCTCRCYLPETKGGELASEGEMNMSQDKD